MGVGINTNSANIDSAVEFLRYYFEYNEYFGGLISPLKNIEMANLYDIIDYTFIYDVMLSTGGLTSQAISEVKTDRSKIYVSVDDKCITSFFDYLDNAECIPSAPDSVKEIIHEEIYNLIDGKITPEAASNNIQNRVKIWLYEMK